MIITFISCYLNHHQLSLCNELKALCDEFYFVATDPIPGFRCELGYEDINTKYDFVVRTYDGSTKKGRVKELLDISDVVIFGSCPNVFIDYRMKQNKLSFLYSERFFKKGVWRRFIPQTRKKVIDRVVKFKDKELYVLCASAFLPWDLELCGFDSNKCFRWGYFPYVKESENWHECRNSPVKLLWAGRMLDWKCAEDAVKAAARLKSEGLDFTLDFIGGGECEDKLKKLTNKLGLSEQVNFLGTMKSSQVIEHMEQADVFLMTSNFYEGWGAVVNEAMSAGCSMLVSSAVGSSAYLIKDGVNGLIYKYGNLKDMERKLRLLIEDKELRAKLGQAGYKTIREEYSAQVAAQRFVEFASRKNKSDLHYESGPMSKAPVIKNNWYRIR